MTKRKKASSSMRQQEFQDKPDFAADWFRETPAKKRPAEVDASNADREVTVKDRLARGTMDKLAALKEQMDKEQASAATKKVAPATKRQPAKPQQTADRDSRGERDPSFSELFDPVDEDEASFDELLKDSKQDWRAFK